MHHSHITLRVRFAETDAMGVVYHARYLEYMEAARVQLMDEMGLPYAKLIELGYHLPLIEASMEYKASAKFDDELRIEADMGTMEGLRIAIAYKVLRAGQIITTGKTVHVFINHSGQPVRPPKEFMALLEAKK